jgi:hypothetical protein
MVAVWHRRDGRIYRIDNDFDVDRYNYIDAAGAIERLFEGKLTTHY